MGVAAADLDPNDLSSIPVKPRLARAKRRFRFRESLDPDLATKVVRTPTARRAKAVARIVDDPSFRTFVAEWDHKIARTIVNLRMGDHVDDVKQDIYLFMSRPHCPECGEEMESCRKHGLKQHAEGKCGDCVVGGLCKQRCKDCGDGSFEFCPTHKIHRDRGLNGLEAYDPSKASFSAYVYHLATLKTLNYRNKLGRDRLALSPTGRDPELQGDRKASKPWEKTHFWLQLERLSEEHETQASGGFFDDDGRLITRDPKTVVGLLLEGHTRPDIAKALRCSIADVDAIILTLRDSEEVRALLAAATVDETTVTPWP